MAVGKHGNDEFRLLAERGTILRVRTGSVVHGISTESSDRDEMGVCIEPPEYVIGLRKFEQYQYRDAAQRTGQFDARSAAGELDLTIYSLRKFVSLALNGNPSIIEILFIPREHVIARNGWGANLQNMAASIVSKEAGPRYLGYLHAQRRAMESGNGKGRDITRPELVERYGWDTKYGGHMIRLGFQGIELLSTGRLTLPMRERERRIITAIRTGAWSMQETLSYAESLEGHIRTLTKASRLPDHPDRDGVNAWLEDAYIDSWGYFGGLCGLDH